MFSLQKLNFMLRVSKSVAQDFSSLLVKGKSYSKPLVRPKNVFMQEITRRFADPVCKFPTFPLQMDPSCRVAIITGGESGIGLAAAKDLLKNGAQVVVLAGVGDGEPVVKQLNEEHGADRVCFMHMDVNDPRDFEELFYRVDLVFGGVDIVFNNAGIMRDDVWEYAIDVNLKSVIRGTILGVNYMGRNGKGKRNGQGLIINHADIAALEGFPYTPGYVASKAGVVGATLSFGAEYHYKNTGVRVVGLLSGPTETDMITNTTEKQLSPDMGRAAVAALREASLQSSTVVGKAVTHIVKYAPTGSFWAVQKGELFLTEFPNWKSFSRKVTQL
ncbi:15-hydroxyprostaglandin dehydrogenase [NAD(+)]-like isoform X2 [Macrosteles quadrilineatus]|uniref:15-hydroxyprostaglandin dehydrogenase [NAD(+)]-like isoform X2 n=1 Tax=Macrosteles quadrilineatus TaxID=74068 RepID=UPI0023E14805|nr:15-hydroxyprostaglandin dehydrogenase [NAD(+)]-like isoform X2 [Macrosteles quadrilineatus]